MATRVAAQWYTPTDGPLTALGSTRLIDFFSAEASFGAHASMTIQLGGGGGSVKPTSRADWAVALDSHWDDLETVMCADFDQKPPPLLEVDRVAKRVRLEIAEGPKPIAQIAAAMKLTPVGRDPTATARPPRPTRRRRGTPPISPMPCRQPPTIWRAETRPGSRTATTNTSTTTTGTSSGCAATKRYSN
jgi:hypothetical protein